MPLIAALLLFATVSMTPCVAMPEWEPDAFYKALDPNCPALLKRALAMIPYTVTSPVERLVIWDDFFAPEVEVGPVKLTHFLRKDQVVFVINDPKLQAQLLSNMIFDLNLYFQIIYWCRMENLPLLATGTLTAVLYPVLWYFERTDIGNQLFWLPFAAFLFKWFVETRPTEETFRATLNENSTRVAGFSRRLSRMHEIVTGRSPASQLSGPTEFGWLWSGGENSPEAMAAIRPTDTGSQLLLMIRNH